MFGLNFNLYHNFALMLSSKERCFKSEARFVASTDAVVEKILAFFDHLSTPGQVDISEGIPLMLQGKLCIRLVNLVCEHSIFKNCELFSFFSCNIFSVTNCLFSFFINCYHNFNTFIL